MKQFVAIWVGVLVGAFGSGQSLQAAELPVYPGKTWETRSPEEAGLSRQKLAALAELVGGRGCVTRHGYMVFSWGDQSQSSDVASAFKPVLTTLLFTAIQEGRLKSVDEKVSDSEPRLKSLNGGRDAAFTWRHLASQTSGYGLAEAPGAAYSYNDYALALYYDTLTQKVFATNGTSVLTTHLAEPLEFEDRFTFNALRNGPSGRLALSVRDFARFGLLYLRGGKWRNQRLLEPAFVQMALDSPLSPETPLTSGKIADMMPNQHSIGGTRNITPVGPGFYSFNWWLNRTNKAGQRLFVDAPPDTYVASGHGGMRMLWVIPSLDLVACWNESRIEDQDKSPGDPNTKCNQAARLLCEAVVDGGVIKAPSGTVLGITNTAFTVNGQPTFLLGVSYYGGLGASENFRQQDLADMKRYGFNWLRVWATWSSSTNDLSAVDAAGQPREPFLARLQQLVAECDQSGIVVDITLSRGNGAGGSPRLQSLPAHRQAVETLVARLKPWRNWYLDLSNERNVRDARFTSFDDLKELRELVRTLDPTRLVTSSDGGDISHEDLKRYLEIANVDFICPHRPREKGSAGQTAAKTAEYLGWMKALGRTIPVQYQEPFRRGYGKWQPSAADFITDARNAMTSGAAGWCFHNGDDRTKPDRQPHRSFDLRQKRLFEQFDEEEQKALKDLADLTHSSQTDASSSAVPSAFVTPMTLDQLDPGGFAFWVDGAEKSIPVKEGPRSVVWTQNSSVDWQGVTFGESKVSGPRHLRIGWKTSLEFGSVLVRGGGQLSALKATASYPGRLDDEADWLPAQRLKDGKVSQEEVGREEYAVWTLPPGTTTRALRFTHTSAPIDKSYAGWLGGVFVLRERLANIAPQAVASGSGGEDLAARLNNTSNDGTWSTWDNAPETNGPVISTEHPAWMMLTWPEAVKLRGLNALWAGFAAVDAQAYVGPADRHPHEATDADWQTIRSFDTIENQYPRALGVNWMDFGREVTARAIRVRVTKAIDEARAHSHLKGKSKDGCRIWLGELLALQPLDSSELASAIITLPKTEVMHPSIPIRFNMPEEGLATLVIEDARGQRVRNLVAETPFAAGENTVWWDGMNDLLRDPAAASHGVYHIPAQFVQPGDYRVRGLWRKPINLRYEFSIYSAGQPAWETADSTGAWLANHTPPCAALFVPGARAPGGKPLVFLGSYVSEGGHGLAWVDLDGRKQGGVGWVGGNWTGAPYLARDDSVQADTNAFAYAAAAWSDDRNSKLKLGEIRLTALTVGGHKPVVKYSFTPPNATNSQSIEWSDYIGGFAAHDGLLVVSMTKMDLLLFVDAKAKKVLGTAELPQPRGLAFDGRQRFYALSGQRLLRFDFTKLDLGSEKILLPPPEVIIASANVNAASMLENPRQLALDGSGNISISDRGRSHQVQVFSSTGKFLRAIGKAGVPKAGPYDTEHMNNPDGLAIDSLNRLWVAENDFQPKRVSVWTLDGKLVRAFYGPSEYGGGGKLDPEDKNRFYYHGMEFRLDWNKSADQLVSVFYRPSPDEQAAPDGPSVSAPPEQPHSLRGRRYFSNEHNNNPTGGPSIAMLWIEAGGIARPVAALGRANDWKLLKGEAFKPLWPRGVDLQGDYGKNGALFAWSDLNGDRRVQPDEIQMQKASVGSITVAPDLSFVASRVGTNAMRFGPQRFTAQGAPVFDLGKGEVLAQDVQGPASSGGDQALWHESGWTILTTPPKPFSAYSIGGVFRGEPRWSYPSLWPGLHASHESPPPGFPGMVIGTTRLLGDFITPPHSDAGPLWCVNGNQGNMYLFTSDGLFVAELFKDVRRGPSWSMPVAQRGMVLNNITLHDENFWPSITQTKDGKVYLVDGGRSSLVRVDGLETIRRLPETTLTLSADELAQARAYFVEAEAARQKNQGSATMKVALRTLAPVVDGSLGDWADADWVDIDRSGVAAYFDSRSKPYDVRGAVAVSGDHLYAAWRTGDENLLRNTADMPAAIFKTGGALDLMIGVDNHADEKRGKPVVGDARLLVTKVKGKTLAVLYRAVVPGTADPVPFSSPWRTITLDRVDDVSAQVQLASVNGNYELSIPLAALGLKPEPGLRLKGDIGILRGNGFQTLQRVYWANKASGITADVPSEAELTPRLWGRWEFKKAP